MRATDSPSRPDTPPPDRLTDAKGLIQNGQFSEALTLLETLIATAPDSDDQIEALYMMAVAQRYTRQLRPALATLDKLLSVNPEYSRGHQERGHLYITLGELDNARQSYARAVELNPALLASWKALLKLYQQAGMKQEEEIAREQATFLEELPAELLSVTDFRHENKLRKAENLCRAFLQKHKHHIEGMRLLGEIGSRLKIFDDAEFLLESCIEFAPDYTRARLDYLNVLIKKSKWKQAHEQAQILLAQQPNNPGLKLPWQRLSSDWAALKKVSHSISRYWRSILASTICIFLSAMHKKPSGSLTKP
ncbi:MAG: tetratricopeptide repeat protein [Gammaproteobacteria bacterium]|nr:tetratricopeptide repeat protein [Gammaproteobacteria bacterium]